MHEIGAIKTASTAYFVENGGTPAAADAPTINTSYGVDVSTQYATYAVAGSATNCSVITATIQNVNADTNNRTLDAHAGRDLPDMDLGGTVLHRTCTIAS